GTAIRVRIRVTFNACTASGAVTASHAGPKPCSNVRQKTNPTGATSSTARYPREAKRSAYLPIVSRHPAAHPADREQDPERDPQDDHRSRSRAAGIAALDPAEHIDGRDLGLEGEVPGDEHDRAEFADSARESERDAGQDRGQEAREDHSPERHDVPRAERRGCI